MLNQRRTLLVAAAAMCLSALSAARAADYPVKPITVVVGYAAGGPTDVLMRAMAPRLTEDLKQQILVDNRPGANEIIAAQIVAKSPPDGYTLFLCTEAPLTQNQFMYSKLNYNPEKDFTPITQLLSAPMTFIVPTTLPVNSLEEFVALAKARTATKPLIYGSAGIGGVSHLPMAMFAKQSGLEMVHVPYKGIAPLVPDVVAARVDAAWVGVAGAAPFVREGKVKALVVAAPVASQGPAADPHVQRDLRGARAGRLHLCADGPNRYAVGHHGKDRRASQEELERPEVPGGQSGSVRLCGGGIDADRAWTVPRQGPSAASRAHQGFRSQAGLTPAIQATEFHQFAEET